MKKKLLEILFFLVVVLMIFAIFGMAVGMFFGFVWLLQYSLTIFSIEVQYLPLVAFVFVICVIMSIIKDFIKK